MKIVLGGSRHLDVIPTIIIKILDNMMSQECSFFVGDAKGSDVAFQEYLFKRKYSQTKVFTSMSEPRNNLGGWSYEVIRGNLKSKSHAMHAFKDREMCKRADAGIMNWDSTSAGTLSNVIDLANQGKKCDVWIAQKRELLSVIDENFLNIFLAEYDTVAIEATRRLSTFRKREERNRLLQPEFSLFSEDGTSLN